MSVTHRQVYFENKGRLMELHREYAREFDFEKEMLESLNLSQKIKPRTAKERRMCNASERESLTRLKVICDIMRDVIPYMTKRSKLVDGLYRDMMLLDSLSQRVFAGFLATVHFDQQKQLLRNVIDSKCIVGVRKVCNHSEDNDFGVWISYRTGAELLEACKDHCVVCPYATGCEHGCSLKKALDELGMDVDHKGGCAYKFL